MACFIRILDHDCDGLVSESDFLHAMGRKDFKLVSVLKSMDDRWQTAALGFEQPNITTSPRRRSIRRGSIVNLDGGVLSAAIETKTKAGI